MPTIYVRTLFLCLPPGAFVEITPCPTVLFHLYLADQNKQPFASGITYD